VELARRVKESTRETDRACRAGGDEFVLLLEDVSGDKNIAFTAGRLLGALSAPVEIDEVKAAVSVSMSIAVYPDAGRELSSLMKMAG
jgi:diguanylate cyclase (GGDEF)-like protein